MVREDGPDTPTHLDGLAFDDAITFADWRHPDFLKLCAEHRGGIKESGYKWGLAVINGVFDLCHLGHVNLANQACEYEQTADTKGLSLFVVALLNSDASAARLKGPNRPIVPLAARAWQLAMLSGVQAVAGFEEDTPEEALKVLRPDFLFKGDEYRGTVVAGAPFCGEVAFLETTPGFSTTEIERRILAAHGRPAMSHTDGPTT
jgi:D-beta-D-heptose 7-phosphate kinase/D-beta-D-heptose 1-phosphate adenosyltransferase